VGLHRRRLVEAGVQLVHERMPGGCRRHLHRRRAEGSDRWA
jgi:hypothetical protein